MMIRRCCFLVLFLAVHTRAFTVDFPDIICSSTAECHTIQDAVCSTASMCECPVGSAINSNMKKCLPAALGFGSSCEENMQCSTRLSTGGTCLPKGTCGCSEGYHYLHGRCWQSIGLNQACTTSDHCYENYNSESLSCSTDNHCVCSPGFYLHESRTYCRRRGKAIGDDCFFDFDCQFDNEIMGVCSTAGKCKAKPESKWQSDPLKYEQGDQERDDDVVEEPMVVSQGAACSADTDCQDSDPNSECSPMNYCWCKRGFFFKGSACMRELGELCTVNTDCQHIANTKCRIEEGDTQGVCSCNALFAAQQTNQMCIRLRPDLTFNCQYLLESCQNFGPLSYCAMPRCECDPQSHFDEEFMTCWVTRSVHENCTDSRDCLTLDGGMVCDAITQQCECNEPDFYETSTGECRKLSLEIGDPCIEDADCAYDTAMCTEGKCGCALGYFSVTDESNNTICATGIGGNCRAAKDCLRYVPQSLCDIEKSECVCNTTVSWLVPSSAGDACVEVSEEIGDPCVDIVQCQAAFGDNTVCANDTCSCIDDYHFRDRACWPKKMLTEKCISTSQCYLPMNSEKTECRNGFCVCKYEFVESGDNKDCMSGGTSLSQNLGVFTFVVVIGSALMTSIL